MAKAEKGPRCCAEVSARGNVWWRAPCSRAGKYEEGGKRYCRQHLPSAIKERDAASAKRWREKFDRGQRLKRDERFQRVAEECRTRGYDQLAQSVLAVLAAIHQEESHG